MPRVTKTKVETPARKTHKAWRCQAHTSDACYEVDCLYGRVRQLEACFEILKEKSPVEVSDITIHQCSLCAAIISDEKDCDLGCRLNGKPMTERYGLALIHYYVHVATTRFRKDSRQLRPLRQLDRDGTERKRGAS